MVGIICQYSLLILDLPTINKISKIGSSKFVENGVIINRI